MFDFMLYRVEADRTLAISQPAHAWISGQLLRRLDVALSEPLLLAGEQHDIGWLDWERAPSFDAGARRPPTFREVGAVVHAPMIGFARALRKTLAGRRMCGAPSARGLCSPACCTASRRIERSR